MASTERADRLQRLQQLRALGTNPYPARTKRTHTTAAVRTSFNAFVDQGSIVVIVGRIRAIREHGKSMFAVIEDGHGTLQAYLKQDELGDAPFAQARLLDVGDFIEVEGLCFRTKTGEETVAVRRCALLTKALRPLPEKYHGLTDTEMRYRHREVDLIANPIVRGLFERRAAIVTACRTYLRERNYLEVETPILQPIPGGANARPFVTHHHALDQDFYLRIAPELYLKRLIVGGFERVFEVARCFRNEGIDRTHNPEFTQIELYEAYADYEAFMGLTEGLFLAIAEALQLDEVTIGDTVIRIAPPFPRVTFRDVVLEYSGVDIALASDDDLRDALTRKGERVDASWSRGKLMDELYKATARPQLVQPTFLIHHPVELSPLAKRHPEDPSVVERFQLVIGGAEVVNAFSELNDPIDQRERFTAQEAALEGGDAEAMRLDEDFLSALEVGMPPTAGLGLGIDRLTMLLTGAANLKEVIAFPALRRNA
ncbi:MAG: lysine--tRNA ligase [bacterium]|nr:lysine--tRNA ligase [bacterium]